MDEQAIRALGALNAAFYAQQAASFSSTRQSAWPGWTRVAEALEPAFSAAVGQGQRALVLDVACGNLRFERFLDERFVSAPHGVYAVDSCAALMNDKSVGNCSATNGYQAFCENTHSCSRAAGGASANEKFPASRSASDGANGRNEVLLVGDVLELLLARQSLTAALDVPPVHAAVCFGFFHHVPTAALRVQLLRQLCEAVRLDGVVAISLWRFADDSAMAAHAQQAHERALECVAAGNVPQLTPAQCAQLEAGDYFLGWQHESQAFRYCHSFSEADIAELCAAAANANAVLIDRFSADGRTGALNEYLVFRAR